MTQANVGPALSQEQESDLRRGQRETDLAEAVNAAEVIEQKIAGMQDSLEARRDEIARLRAEMEG